MDLFVLKAKVHSAKVMDYEAIKALLRRAEERFPRLRHLWLDAPATAEKTRAQKTGSRRLWDGAWSSSSAPESPPRKRC
jgi:hypothetical protein